MRAPSPVVILLVVLSSSTLGSEEPVDRESTYMGCYALTESPPAGVPALGLPRQIEFTIEPMKDARGRSWDGQPLWRFVRIIQPAGRDPYGGWGWRLVRERPIEMQSAPLFGSVGIKLNGSPKVLVGTAKYTSDDFSGPPAVPIRAERVACGIPPPR
jgi:hypothetical protein